MSYFVISIYQSLNDNKITEQMNHLFYHIKVEFFYHLCWTYSLWNFYKVASMIFFFKEEEKTLYITLFPYWKIKTEKICTCDLGTSA